MLKQRLTAAAAALAAVLAAAAQVKTPSHLVVNYGKLTHAQQAEVVAAHVDAILADPYMGGRLVTYLGRRARNDETDERGRKLAFDALIRVFEATEAMRAARPDPDGLPTGPKPVRLVNIDWAVPGWGSYAGLKPGGPGREYVRKVFDTWDPPPPEAADIEVREYVLRHPWCEAGDLLFGGPDGEVNRAYGIQTDPNTLTLKVISPSPKIRRPPPPKRKLSPDAARWWNLCWDGRPWGEDGGLVKNRWPPSGYAQRSSARNVATGPFLTLAWRP